MIFVKAVFISTEMFMDVLALYETKQNKTHKMYS